MANEKKTDCVILGFLSHEPMSGYEIKKRIDTALRFFWNGSYGSIYPALSALEADGCVTKRASDESRREKTIYTITEKGREYLFKWLSDPVAKDELRYETMLKLFFGGELGNDATRKRIELFEERIRAELPFLEMCVAQLEAIKSQSGHLNYLLTAKFGVETYKGYLRWCEEAKALLQPN